MESVLRCIYNIPICGGFCAPTVNPDESFLKHFSNEYTVPGAGIYMRCSPFIETNRCCRRCGRIGSQWGRQNRKPCMVIAFAVSFAAWLMTFYAALGMSMNPAVLKAAAWVNGEFWHEKTRTKFHIAVGLKGRIDTVDCRQTNVSAVVAGVLPRSGAELCATAFNGSLFDQVEDGVWERVVPWEDDRSCWSAETTQDVRAQLQQAALQEWDFASAQSFNGEACSMCRSTAMASVSFVIMGVLTQIPQMTTDLQRSTRFGDVNCQATMGAITGFTGAYSTLASLGTFSQSCWRNFPGQSFAGKNIHWTPGPALICLVIATLLKFWDAISHLLVPTPLARQVKPKKGLELADYMGVAVRGGELDSEVGDVDSDSDSDEESVDEEAANCDDSVE